MCLHVPELFRSRGHSGDSMDTPTLPPLCAHSLIYSDLSGFRGAPTRLHSHTVPASVSGCCQNGDGPPLSSCWALLLQIGLWWKGRLLVIQNTATEDPVSPCPSLSPHCLQRSPLRQPVFIKAKYLLPSPSPTPANRTWKIWAILGFPFFPYLCQCPSCRFPLFPVL